MVWNRNLFYWSHTAWAMLIFAKTTFWSTRWIPVFTGHKLIYKTIFLLRYWSDVAEISRWSFPPMLEHIVFQLPPDFWSIQLFLFLVLPSAIEFLLPNLFDIFQLRFEPHFLLAILQSPTVIAYKQFSNWCCMAHVGIILRDSERFLRKHQSEIKLLFENRPYCNSFYFLIDGCCVDNPLSYLSIV